MDPRKVRQLNLPIKTRYTLQSGGRVGTPWKRSASVGRTENIRSSEFWSEGEESEDSSPLVHIGHIPDEVID